jgi:hypothetical protein
MMGRHGIGYEIVKDYYLMASDNIQNAPEYKQVKTKW